MNKQSACSIRQTVYKQLGAYRSPIHAEGKNEQELETAYAALAFFEKEGDELATKIEHHFTVIEEPNAR